MLLTSVGHCRIPQRRTGKRAVELIFCKIKARRAPKKRLGPRGGLDGRNKVTGKEARLQLCNPVPATDHRRLTVQVTLEQNLVELCMVKGAKFRCGAPECSDKPELQIGKGGEGTEIGFLRKVKPGLGCTFHLIERNSCPQE